MCFGSLFEVSIHLLLLQTFVFVLMFGDIQPCLMDLITFSPNSSQWPFIHFRYETIYVIDGFVTMFLNSPSYEHKACPTLELNSLTLYSTINLT